MQIFLLLLLIKIAFTILVFVFGAVLMIELLPAMASWATSVTAGTAIAEIGGMVAKGLMWMANLAERFLNFMIQFLNKFGLDISAVKVTAQEVTREAGQEAGKIDPPSF